MGEKRIHIGVPGADEQWQRFFARLDELCDRAVQGAVVSTDFLTPLMARRAQQHLQRCGQWERARLWGGYAAAERVCLFLFPDYALPYLSDATDVPDVLTQLGEDDPLALLCVRGSGYRTLSHRDYLGSLLGLGLERDVLGDILVDATDTAFAVVICQRRMLPFLIDQLDKVANDRVRVSAIDTLPAGMGERHFTELHDTVASPRLDGIVAALCHLSREAAQTAVRDGRVEVNYEVELRVDHTIEPTDVITVRGCGKFILQDIGTPTRKGRLRLVAVRYV